MLFIITIGTTTSEGWRPKKRGTEREREWTTDKAALCSADIIASINLNDVVWPQKLSIDRSVSQSVGNARRIKQYGTSIVSAVHATVPVSKSTVSIKLVLLFYKQITAVAYSQEVSSMSVLVIRHVIDEYSR